MGFIPYVPSPICPLCGLERREGDTHMAYVDGKEGGSHPSWGCRVLSECRFPLFVGTIRSTPNSNP